MDPGNNHLQFWDHVCLSCLCLSIYVLTSMEDWAVLRWWKARVVFSSSDGEYPVKPPCMSPESWQSTIHTYQQVYDAPHFEEVEEAYWFGPVCACVRVSHFPYGQEQLEIGSWNLLCRISMKNKRTYIFFLFRRTFLCRVMPLFWRGFFTLPLWGYGTLSTKYLENPLS